MRRAMCMPLSFKPSMISRSVSGLPSCSTTSFIAAATIGFASVHDRLHRLRSQDHSREPDRDTLHR